MDPALRIVTQLPLPELWNEHGLVEATRERTRRRADVKSLLQSTPVQFVVADVGKHLRWIPEEDRFVFWKSDARDHIVEDPERPIDIYAYPEGYAYVASEWVGDPLAPARIVLLERYH